MPLASARARARRARVPAPRSLRLVYRLHSRAGADIDVHCIDKSSDAYVAPPVVIKPFAGAGRSMRAEGSDAGGGVAVEPREAVVDSAAPTTTLQLRMPDGTRKVLKLNHSHRVGELRAHVATLVAPVGARFELATPMPRVKLVDDAPTLSEVGLLNNTVLVTLL